MKNHWIPPEVIIIETKEDLLKYFGLPYDNCDNWKCWNYENLEIIDDENREIESL